MPFTKLNDKQTIYYELFGKGQPLVLISGYRGDHFLWELLQDILSTHFQLLIFDNLAIGQTTDDDSPLTIEKMAIATIQLIEHLQLTKPHVVGQSMGGAIAQSIAKNFPEKINKLVLLNTVMKFNHATLIALDAMLKLREENATFESLFAAGLAWSFSSNFLELESNIQAHKNRLTQNPYPQSIENQKRQLNALKNFNSTNWVETISNPTLVVASDQDIVAKPNESLLLANKIKNAQFATIPSGHASIFESPNELLQLFIEFFGNYSP